MRALVDPIVYIDHSEVREGKLEELKAAMNELVAFVEANEPQLISYTFSLSEDATQMTVIAVHPDPDSMEFHMKVAGPGFRKFRELITLSSIEIYGGVNDRLLGLLQQKAEMLGNASVIVHDRYAGFDRYS